MAVDMKWRDAMSDMQSALEVAQQRQQWGAAALQSVVPADGVLLSVKATRQGGGLEQLVWPGILRQLDASGEVLAQCVRCCPMPYWWCAVMTMLQPKPARAATQAA